jgi:hypothetical protein
MKEQIIQYLMEHPESRKRAIAYHLKVWQCDTQFLAAMCELQQEGLIKSTYHRIPENMEFYDTFSVTGA